MLFAALTVYSVLLPVVTPFTLVLLPATTELVFNWETLAASVGAMPFATPDNTRLPPVEFAKLTLVPAVVPPTVIAPVPAS